MKRSFFQAAVASILLYGCTTWTLTKRLEKKLDGNYSRMLRAIINKSLRQHPTRHQLYGHLPPLTKTIQVRRTRHAGHCWRSRDELISDVLLWTPTHGRAKAGRPARTYIQQLCEDTGCCPEDLPEAMNHMEEWRERVRDIRATSTTWWWGWWYFLGSIAIIFNHSFYLSIKIVDLYMGMSYKVFLSNVNNTYLVIWFHVFTWNRNDFQTDLFEPEVGPYWGLQFRIIVNLAVMAMNIIPLSRFLRRSSMIFIIKGFRTIVFFFIVISTTFRPICPPAFFGGLSNSGTFTELRTTSFIESMGVACSDSVSHNRVHVLSIPLLLLACSQDWTCNLQKIFYLET